MDSRGCTSHGGIGDSQLLWTISSGRPTESHPSASNISREYSAGERVEIRAETTGEWAHGAIGTVAEPPATVREIAGDWTGESRLVLGLRGPVISYWVDFDKPRKDPDGDGPFFGAEIQAEDLRPGPASSLQGGAPPELRVAAWVDRKQETWNQGWIQSA